MHLGKKHEAKPLLISVLYKAFLFGLLVFGFHIVEEVIKRLVHGKNMVGAFHDVRIDDLLARSVVVFCTFIPLFLFLELRRAVGEDRFRDLLVRTGATAKSNLLAGKRTKNRPQQNLLVRPTTPIETYAPPHQKIMDWTVARC